MTRVAREFENLLLAVRSSVATQRPVSCELLDNLIVKTKGCFAAQKQILNRGLYAQILLPFVGAIRGTYKPASTGSVLLSSRTRWSSTRTS